MDKDIRNLRYSIPDAAVLADRFKGFGYKTRLLSDPTSAELRAAVLGSIDGLGRGDVFLFFFAGHGFTAQDGSHLLFCRDDIQKLLRVGNAGVKVDALEVLTCEGGFHRAFFLDSCRTDCFTGVENRGNEETRDLDFVKIPEPTDETGSYYLLRSCDKFRPSLEIKELGHGLFTQGLLDAIDARDRRLGGCNTDFATAVRVKMADRQKQYNVDISQRPSIGESSGSVFSLFDDEFFSDIEKSDLSTMQSSPRVSTLPAAAIPTYVVCPICGKKNKIEDTFKCRQCGRDDLCLRHQDEKMFLCTECIASHDERIIKYEATQVRKESNHINKIIILGYSEWYAICPKIKVFIDGKEVGLVSRNGKLVLSVKKECIEVAVEYATVFRNRSTPVLFKCRDGELLLRIKTDRWAGALSIEEYHN